MVALSEAIIKKSPEAPHGGGVTMTSYPVGNKTSLSRKPCIADKSYYGTQSASHGRSYRIRHAKSWSFSNFYKKTASINLKNFISL